MALVMLWGTSFLFNSISIRTIEPISVVFYRLVLGALVLSLVVFARGLSFPRELRIWGGFLLMAIAGNALPFFLITWGQLSVNSGVAGMIMAIMPLITMLLAHYFVEGEDLNRYKIIGFALGLGGIILLLGPVFEGGGQAVFGGIAVFFAAVSYAVNTILVRRFPKFNPIVGAAGVLIGASITMLPIWLIQAPPLTTQISNNSMLSVIWLGIGPTAIATLLLFAVIERAGPTFLATINYMIPVVAFFAGAYILSEPVELSSLFALAIILSGIAFTRFRANSLRPAIPED